MFKKVLLTRFILASDVLFSFENEKNSLGKLLTPRNLCWCLGFYYSFLPKHTLFLNAQRVKKKKNRFRERLDELHLNDTNHIQCFEIVRLYSIR